MEIRKIAGIAPDDRAAVDEASPESSRCGGVLQLARGISLRPGSQLPDVPYGRLADAALRRCRTLHGGARHGGQRRGVDRLGARSSSSHPTQGCTTISKPPASDGCCSGRANPGPRPMHASPEVLAGVKRYTTLPCGEPFAEREGDQPLVAHAGHPPRRRFSAMR